MFSLSPCLSVFLSLFSLPLSLSVFLYLSLPLSLSFFSLFSFSLPLSLSVYLSLSLSLSLCPSACLPSVYPHFAKTYCNDNTGSADSWKIKKLIVIEFGEEVRLRIGSADNPDGSRVFPISEADYNALKCDFLGQFVYDDKNKVWLPPSRQPSFYWLRPTLPHEITVQ